MSVARLQIGSLLKACLEGVHGQDGACRAIWGWSPRKEIMLRSNKSGEITKAGVRPEHGNGTSVFTRSGTMAGQPAQAYGSGASLYFLYPSAVSRITPRTCSSTSPSFLNSAIAKRAEEESTVCLDRITN